MAFVIFCTVRFLIPGRRALFFGQIFGIRQEGGGMVFGIRPVWGGIQFYRPTGADKCSFTVPQGRINTVLQYYRDGQKRGKTMYKKSHVINLAV